MPANSQTHYIPSREREREREGEDLNFKFPKMKERGLRPWLKITRNFSVRAANTVEKL